MIREMSIADLNASSSNGVCSSVASGLSTCRKLIEKRQLDDDAAEDEFDELLAEMPEAAGVMDAEVRHLNEVIYHLEQNDSDPKLDSCISRGEGLAGGRVHHLQPVLRYGALGRGEAVASLRGRDRRRLRWHGPIRHLSGRGVENRGPRGHQEGGARI